MQLAANVAFTFTALSLTDLMRLANTLIHPKGRRKKGLAGDIFTVVRVRIPPKSAALFFKTGNAYSRLWVPACFLFWTASPSMLYPAVSSSVILRMLLSIFAESRYVSFKILNG
jgi:hypothetical protein